MKRFLKISFTARTPAFAGVTEEEATAFLRFIALAGLLLLGVVLSRSVPVSASEDSYHLYLQGLLQERFGKPEDALTTYEKVLGLDPEAYFVHEAMASLALRLAQTDRALVEAEKIIKLDPKSPHSYLVMGRVHLARGELVQAREAFDHALALEPNDNEALLYSAHIRVVSQPKEALELYDRFIQNNPNSMEARVRVAELHQRLGDWDAARDSWQKALELDPTDFATHLALAHLYEIQQDTAAAIAAYEECRFLDSENVGILMRLGELYYRYGKTAEALETFQQAFHQDPKDPSVNFWLALLAEEQKDWKTAVSYMARVSEQSAEPAVLLRLAYYQSQGGHPRQAMVSLKKILKKDRQNPDFLYYVALGYEDLQKPRKAVRWLEKVVARDSDRADAYFHLGTNWDSLKKFDRAEPYLIRAIELNPDHAVALNYVGYSWAERGKNLDQALSYVQRAVALEPENGAFLDSLGWVYFKMGRWTEAESALGRAVTRAEDPTVWEHYGDVLAKIGRTAEAQRAWQEGLILDPGSPGLLRRVGGQARNVTPLTAPRRLLKRVEGNYRQLKNLTGVMQMSGRGPGRAFQVQGLFRYARPELFRFEIWGPFFVPEALVVRNSSGLASLPVGSKLDIGNAEDSWLRLLADFLSGELLRRFDSPATRVEQKGSQLAYTADAGELQIDGKKQLLTRFDLKGAASPSGGGIRFALADYHEVEGIWIPFQVDCEMGETAFKLSLRLSHVKVNSVLDESLFRLPSAPSQSPSAR